MTVEEYFENLKNLAGNAGEDKTEFKIETDDGYCIDITVTKKQNKKVRNRSRAFMKKQKFEIRIAVGGDDENVRMEIEVWKDGKISDFSLLEGDNLRLACESMKNALGVVARRYIEQLHKEGKITDEQYQELRAK